MASGSEEISEDQRRPEAGQGDLLKAAIGKIDPSPQNPFSGRHGLIGGFV
jgi:hypothetical protein